MEIAALVSGGVDSSVIVPLLKDQGYNPVLCYIQIGMENEAAFMDCPSEEDIEITEYIARKYGCRFEIINLHKEYWDNVVKYTMESVEKGLTPNPDVMCNKMIKFGSFEEKFGHNFDKIATGHYADTYFDGSFHHLKTAKDHKKDQTYFLGRITYSQLSKLLFPLAQMTKNEVREKAEQEKLPSARRKDSQGICFLGKINYNDFIRQHLGEKTGKIVELETGKILGTHKGYWFHTIGQRKGLGLAQGPWFVVDKNAEENIIFVSHGYDPESQYKNLVVLKDFRFLSNKPFDLDQNNHEITFKIRHTPEFSHGHISAKDDNVIINATKPIAGLAPGQFAVVYDKDKNLCLGSGIIN